MLEQILQESSWPAYVEELQEEAAAKALRRLILRQGNRKFGAIGDADRAALNAIEASERLERLSDALMTATSWKELLETV